MTFARCTGKRSIKVARPGSCASSWGASSTLWCARAYGSRRQVAADNNYHLEGWQHFFQPEEDRKAAELWKKGSKCLGIPELERFFFPDSDDPDARNLTKKGKRICLGQIDDDDRPCPALQPCLEYAMENR